MARTDGSTQQITRAGLNPNLTAPTVEGDVIDGGNTFLWVDNGSGSSVTVTVQATASQDGLDVADLAVAVPAGEVRAIGPFPARTFAQASDAAVGANRVLVDYSAVPVGLVRAVISL